MPRLYNLKGVSQGASFFFCGDLAARQRAEGLFFCVRVSCHEAVEFFRGRLQINRGHKMAEEGYRKAI